MNIVDNILHQCRCHAPVVAMGAAGTTFNVVSYGRLERFIHNVSRKAVALGLSRGQIVAIFVMDPVLHAAIALGLTRLGVITLSGRNPMLPKELGIAALITDTDFPYEAAKIIRVDQGWVAGDGNPVADSRLYQTRADEICRIVLTSGTTGDAKAIALTHRMVAARVARHAAVFGNLLPLCSRTYCDLGLATSLGFQFLIYMLGRGGAIFFPGRSVEHAVQALATYGAGVRRIRQTSSSAIPCVSSAAIGFPAPIVQAASATITRPTFGWVAGVGAEHMFTRNLSVRSEILYYDLGRNNATTSITTPFPETFRMTATNEVIVSRVGLSLKW
jgi:acyl-CoA synthetase (AMP-forming)/AMP-acid ligase II